MAGTSYEWAAPCASVAAIFPAGPHYYVAAVAAHHKGTASLANKAIVTNTDPPIDVEGAIATKKVSYSSCPHFGCAALLV